MKLSNEFKIGFWALVTLIIMYLGVNYLKGIQTLKQGDFYYLSCDRVPGLAISSHVKLHGLKIGIVRDMQYEAKSDHIIVTLNIYNTDIKIPVDSRISIAEDLLGTADVNIEMGESTKYFATWDTIYAPAMAPGLMEKADPIIAQIETLFPKIDTLVAGINVLVNDSKLHESLLEVNKASTKLNQTLAQLNTLLKNDVPTVMSNVKSASANLDTISTQLKDAEIEQVLANANRTINEVNETLQKIQTDDNSVGRLLNSTELHDHLSNTIASVDSLVNAIKENPKKYIRVKVF